MKPRDLRNVEEPSDFKKVAPGGYICMITSVTDVPEKEYLKLEYDIVDGEFKNFYRDLYAAKGFWGANFIKSHGEKAEQFFLQFINCVKNSPNPTFDWNMAGETNEQKLKNKYLGLVLGEEEYKANSGDIKKRLYVAAVKTVNDIRTQNYEIPALKQYVEPAIKKAISELPPDDDSLPF